MRMSRFALILLVAMVAVAAYLLGLDTQRRESAVKALIARIEDDRRAIHMLKAEEAFLSRPQRLQTLANDHLNLRPPLPGQIYDNAGTLPPAGVQASAYTYDMGPPL